MPLKKFELRKKSCKNQKLSELSGSESRWKVQFIVILLFQWCFRSSVYFCGGTIFLPADDSSKKYQLISQTLNINLKTKSLKWVKL